jgi:signal transduction histidine kinase
LAQALRDAAEEIAHGAPIHFRVIVEGPPSALDPAVSDEMVRICSEAILNAFKHSEAKNIEVNLTYLRTSIQIRISDDGVGIDPKVFEMGGRQGHFGLLGMRERAEKIKAEFTLSSRVKAGTEVEIIVPAAVAYAKRAPLQSHRYAPANRG